MIPSFCHFWPVKRFILITGASSGIGRHAALLLAGNGYHILAGVRREDDARALTDEGKGQIYPLILDVTNSESVESAAKSAADIIGEAPLVAIINNAGIAVSGPVLYVPTDAWKEQLEVNVVGVVRVTQAFFPLLSRRPSAEDQHPRRIINIGSVSGLFASPFVGPYAASKFALEAITDSLRRELFMYDIQVVVIEAGSIDTRIWDKAQSAPDYTGPEYEGLSAFRSRMIDHQKKTSMPVESIGSLILNVIVSRKVRVRYLLRRKKWKFNLIRFLPAAWVDRMIHKGLRARIK